MARIFTSIDDVRGAVGEPIGPSQPLTIDQHRIDVFAEITDDLQWIHTDPERAVNGPFGTTIAHGYLSLALLPHFGRELFNLDFGSARVNYGVNKVRFPTPIPVDSELRATVTFTDVSEVATGALVTAKYLLDAGSTKPACIAETLVLVVR